MQSSPTLLSLFEVALANAGLFIFFTMSFFKMNQGERWRSFGPWRAFVVKLYTDMYGVPLTIYLLSGWYQPRLPGVEWIAHAADALLKPLFGWQPSPHFGLLQLLGVLIMGGGAVLVAAAWKPLYHALRQHFLVLDGVYGRVRHPLYLGLFIVMSGVLLLCPTLVTVAMFVVLLVMYVRLAHEDERNALAAFGSDYEDYRRRVPAFIPPRRALASKHGL